MPFRNGETESNFFDVASSPVGGHPLPTPWLCLLQSRLFSGSSRELWLFSSSTYLALCCDPSLPLPPCSLCSAPPSIKGPGRSHQGSKAASGLTSLGAREPESRRPSAAACVCAFFENK